MSQARDVYERCKGAPLPFIGAYPAPCSVSGANYSVSYFSDNSILICLNGQVYRVLDEPKTYYREDVEHAARCLGAHGLAGIARIVREKYGDQPRVTIDNVTWSNAGELVDVS